MGYVNTQFIVVPFVLILLIVSSSESVNITNLLIKYVSVCGPKLCNLRHPSLPVKFDYMYEDHSGCAECACDDECWTRGNCCPDVYLSFSVHSCVKNTILQNKWYKNEEIGYLMVERCDRQEDVNIDYSFGKGEQLRHLPVTSAQYNFTFRNETTASCNGVDTDSNWVLGFRCPVMTDFNYLPSYAEIEERAISNQCRISFHPHDVVAARCKTPSRSTVLNKCNMTGHWWSRDDDVDWACGYYGPEVMKHTFSDVYCYICNPANSLDDKIISKCNATELWDAYDKTIDAACKAYPLTQRTYPFKNYFCRLCNQVSKHNSLFVDADASVEIWPTMTQNSKTLYRHEFKDVKFDPRFLQSTLKSYEESYNPMSNEEKNDTVFRDGKIINITNLLLQYYLTTGFYDVCHKEYLKVSYDKLNSSCVCDPRCIFNDEKCCVDLALIHSACVNELEMSPLQHILSPKEDPNEHLAVTGCLAKGSNPAYSERCRNRTKEDITILDILPVENTNTTLVFENIYCALCGQDLSTKIVDFLKDIKPFSVEILCNDPLPYENEILLLNTIRRAQSMKCRIRTLPQKTKTVCNNKKSNKNGQCHTLGRTDSDVVWGCENTNVNTLPEYGNYKNVFCKTCAAMISRPAVFKSCPRTTEPGLAEACETYPAVPVLYPYKNAFCKKCMIPSYVPSFSSKQPDNYVPEQWSPLPTLLQTDGLKGIFSVFVKEPKEQRSEKCKEGEKYDTWGKTCRKILCYPGKVLDGNMCTPLISVATNLSYAISYNLIGEITHTETSPSKILQNTERYIKEHLEVLFNLRKIENVRFLSFHAFSNVSCNYRFGTSNDARMSILLKATVHVNDTIKRLKSEEELVYLPGKNIKIYDSKMLIPFEVHDEKIAYNLSNVIREMKQAGKCYITGNVGQEDKEREFYHVATVSELLLCKQVELRPTEFEVDSTKMTLKIKNSNVVLSYKKFMLTENRSARICFDRLPVANASSCNSGDKTLSIFTVVVMSISLICLIPPFVTYCLFPKLQTLPGLNSMALFASLFVVQIIFMIQYIGEVTNACSSDGFCVTVGLISHLAWLVFFTWTFICSLHMFFVFVSSDYQSNDSNRWGEFRRYIIGSISFPLTIIVVHVGLTAAITKGDEIGYGRTRCFISNPIGTVLSFIVPVATICIINAVFFFKAYRKISERTKVSNSQHDQQLLRAMLKLFVLTGVTWILQIIDGFLPLSPFSYIVTLLNGLQGLFIFILFVCNSAVLNMYRNFKKTIKEKRPRQTYSSTVRRKYKDLAKSGSSSAVTSDINVSYDFESRDHSQSYDNLAFADHIDSKNEQYTNLHQQFSQEKVIENENIVSNPESISKCETVSVNSNCCESIDDNSDMPENPESFSKSETVSVNSNCCDSIDDSSDMPENPTDISLNETDLADIDVSP